MKRKRNGKVKMFDVLMHRDPQQAEVVLSLLDKHGISWKRYTKPTYKGRRRK